MAVEGRCEPPHSFGGPACSPRRPDRAPLTVRPCGRRPRAGPGTPRGPGPQATGSRTHEKATPEPTMTNTSDILRLACEELTRLTGCPAETVSSFERADGRWRLTVEVLELPRIPDTVSLLATYEVETDGEGQLTAYRRVRRYERGRADAHVR
nr:gas vesicle protein GvpO [Streptomyces sp. CC210A]